MNITITFVHTLKIWKTRESYYIFFNAPILFLEATKWYF